MFKYPKNQSGVVILYALLIIALITAIGIGVSIVIVKELRLTQNTHFATMAYYAAESGVEKALYTVKISREAKSLNDTLNEIQGYKLGQANYIIFANDASYNDEQTSAQEKRVETSLAKDQVTQFDVYDIYPEQNKGVKSLSISWSDANPEPENLDIPWLEISYVKWDPVNLTFTEGSFRDFYSLSQSQVSYPLPDMNSNYRIRIKALYDGASNLVVTAYDTDNQEISIPDRITVKSVGKMGEFEQAITALVPWNVPLFGLYDYVLYSEGQIEKKIIVGAPIYTSGAIQVEEAIKLSPLPSFCENCSNKGGACSVPLATCAECGWSAQNCICDARCDIETDGTGTCKLDNNSTIWQLPIPSSVAASDKYYLNIRAKYPVGYNSADKFYVIINDNNDGCISIPDQADGYVSCTIESPNFEIYPQHCFNGRLDEDETSTDAGGSCPATPLINNKIQFEHPTTSPSTFEIDWYQLSTYKLFDDCKNVVESCPNRPTFPEAGNGLCEACETRFPGDQDGCSAAQCRIPRCSDGICDNDTFKQDGSQHTGFCDGEKQRCCGGVCKNLDCVNNSHCVDTNTCTNDSCNYDGICTASCTNELKCDGSTCAIGSPDYCNTVACIHCGDGTCNCGETSVSCSADCETSPDYEYLRYIALDENAVNLTALRPSGSPGKSQRPIPVWQDKSYGTDYNYRAVYVGDANHVWAVGGETSPSVNARIAYYKNGVWGFHTPLSTAQLNGVWAYKTGPNPDDFQYWAVGNSGMITHCKAGCAENTPSDIHIDTSGTGNNLNAIFGINASNIWAVGASGIILSYNSTTDSWSQVGSVTNTLYGVWAYNDAGTIKVWVVGDSGTIRYCSGGCGGSPTWTSQTSNSTYVLTAISGNSTSNIWISAKCTGAVCTSYIPETILYSSNGGSTWIKQNGVDKGSGVTDHLFGISAYIEPTSPQVVRAIAVGATGAAYYYDGSTWTQETTGSTNMNRAVHAYDWQNIWVVGNYAAAGQNGIILYGNAPNNIKIVVVGNSSDQYWLSKEYTSFDPLNGAYTANLNITRKPGGGKSVIIKARVGYCNNGCDQVGDFYQWGTDSAAQTVSGSGTQFLIFQITSGDFSCTNCRFWTRIWNSTATTNTFDMSVSGRENGFLTATQRDSNIDIP